jgi:hypothetical protein
MNLPHWEGWHLIGAFESDVGSWILHHEGEALLLEVPEGLTVADVRAALKQLGSPRLKYVTASHDHEDHLDASVWESLRAAFPPAMLLHPSAIQGELSVSLGGEPLWLLKAPKHSRTDVVTIFRGVAMTGDIELGMLESVNQEVRATTKLRSMARLAGFVDRTGYQVHSLVSAHLDDVRTHIDWPRLFQV